MFKDRKIRLILHKSDFIKYLQKTKTFFSVFTSFEIQKVLFFSKCGFQVLEILSSIFFPKIGQLSIDCKDYYEKIYNTIYNTILFLLKKILDCTKTKQMKVLLTFYIIYQFFNFKSRIRYFSKKTHDSKLNFCKKGISWQYGEQEIPLNTTIQNIFKT